MITRLPKNSGKLNEPFENSSAAKWVQKRLA